jgi:hypothetical protein
VHWIQFRGSPDDKSKERSLEEVWRATGKLPQRLRVVDGGHVACGSKGRFATILGTLLAFLRGIMSGSCVTPAADCGVRRALSRRISVAIIHTTQLPLLFISRLGFAPRFRASGFAPPPPQWHPPQYPIVGAYHSRGALNCTTLNYAASCLNCHLCECNTKPKYLRQKHGGVPNGPRRETEARKSRIVAKIQTPFHASERAPVPTSGI